MKTWPRRLGSSTRKDRTKECFAVAFASLVYGASYGVRLGLVIPPAINEKGLLLSIELREDKSESEAK